MKILYKNWFVYNVIAHPLMYLVGLLSKNMSRIIHDSTLPDTEGERQ